MLSNLEIQTERLSIYKTKNASNVKDVEQAALVKKLEFLKMEETCKLK
jgi:hypothetical protein